MRWSHHASFTDSVFRQKHADSGRKKIVENLWRDFFLDPSAWWDHRPEKVNARHPDFKHKKTGESLWLDSKLNPSWVGEKVMAVAPRVLQMNIFSWNKTLASYVKAGEYEKTLKLFQQVQRQDIDLDQFTFVPILNACASLRALNEGRHVHSQIIQRGLESNVFVGTSLVDMYAKCGNLEDACSVFNKMPVRNVVSWSAMILGYVKCGAGQKALELFQKMRSEGVEPNSVTFVGILNACASVLALEEGQRVHQQIIQSGFESNNFVHTSLVNMYAKCGSIGDAWTVFNKVPNRNVASWSAMILGYVKCGQGQKALELVRQMQQDGVKPNPMTLVGWLNACASVAALEEGRRVHDWITQSNCESDVFVANSLIDMYAKCGSLEEARRVFKNMPTPDVVSWTTMLGGYAMHGYAKEAVEHFEHMHQEGVHMDGVTFLSLLSACSRGGLVDEGLHYFVFMSSIYSAAATLEHYASLVDLLGRAGRLHEAEDWVKISSKPSASSWRALLSACKLHGNVEMGEYVARRVMEIEPGNASGYLMLSNLYAATE